MERLLKPYKVKLKTTPVTEAGLKRMAGTYRKLYNTCLEALVFSVIQNDPKYHFMSGATLTKVLKLGRNSMFPFLKEMDAGLLSAAAYTSSIDFRLKFKYRPNTIPYISRKKSNLKFKTKGCVQVFSDYITVPKLGRIDLTEVDRIPTGVTYSGFSFTHDGSDWYITVLIDTIKENNKEELTDETIYADFTNDGNLILNGKELLNITSTEKYIKKQQAYRKLYRKLKRQTKTNSIIKHDKAIPVSTKNITKTKRKLSKIKAQMNDIKKDSMRKTVHEVAILKPKELHILDNVVIGKKRNNYLTRNQRKSGSRDLLSMLIHKLSVIGTSVIRHHSEDDFRTSLGSRV